MSYSSDQRRRARDQDIAGLAWDARVMGEARMLRDEEELTPDLRLAVVHRFRELLARIKKSETWAARSMDMSASTLSQVLSATYEGDWESRIRKIDKWTEVQHARESAPAIPSFAQTTTALEIIGAAKMAQGTDGIVVVHGPSGIGKTIVSQYLLSDMPGAFGITIDEGSRTSSSIYDMICRELRIPAAKLSSHQKRLAIIEVLRGSHRLMIVDELHQLCGARVDAGLHALRGLFDVTGCPQLWLGTADLANWIIDGRDHTQAIEQIYGRVTYWLDLTFKATKQDGGPGLHTIEDIRKMVAAHQIRVTPDAELYLTQQANTLNNGGLRAIMQLCKLAKKRFGDKPLTRDLLSDIQADRRGPRLAKIEATKQFLVDRKVAVG